MLNQVIIMGRLTKEPEAVKSGEHDVARFSIAVDTLRKGANGENEADFFDCTAFDKTAISVLKFVHKGNRVIVDGRLVSRVYTSKKTGQNIRSVSIMANHVEFIEPAPKKEEDALMAKLDSMVPAL